MLSVVTLATMPPLAAAKRRVGEQLGSSATTSESRQTMLCAYLSGALLIGLLANAALGWWWGRPTRRTRHRPPSQHEKHATPGAATACACCA